MLTKQESIAEYDFVRGQIYPDRLTRNTHADYLSVASQLLKLYSNSVGLLRRQIHQCATAFFDPLPACPARRIAAFIKLLDDVSEYESDRGRKSAQLRRSLFHAASAYHPLVNVESGVFGSNQWKIKNKLADDLNMKWSEIERKLFSDVIEFHPLKSFTGYDNPAELLARYNVAQVQASLYRATRMTLWAKSDLKTIVRTIKLSRLMHSIQRTGIGEYQFVIDGPASTLRPTRRYGVAMARMIPVLVSCRDWRFVAPISIGSAGQKLSFELCSEDGLNSSKSNPPEFDSIVESDLMEKWNRTPVENWTLTRESELLFSEQKVFTPDFVATHSSGKQVYVEIMGYWTPEYLNAKLQTLRHFSHHNILVIAQENKQAALAVSGIPPDPNWLWYKTKISLSEFQKSLARYLLP